MRREIQNIHTQKNGMEMRDSEPKLEKSDLLVTEKGGFVRACPGPLQGCWGLLAMIYDTSRVE